MYWMLLECISSPNMEHCWLQNRGRELANRTTQLVGNRSGVTHMYTKSVMLGTMLGYCTLTPVVLKHKRSLSLVGQPLALLIAS